MKRAVRLCAAPAVALLILTSACRSAGWSAGPAPGRDSPRPEVVADVSAQRTELPTRPAGEPHAGALEIGDPYYPGLGNGGYDVQHYDLDLDLDLDSDELEAKVTVRALALQELRSFSLDLHGLEVTSVLVDGRPAAFERPPALPGQDGKPQPPGELVIRPAGALAAGAVFVTQVLYSGSPEPRPDPAVPFLPGVGWARMESGVYVVSECIGASSWYPCNDHPRDKATYSFRIRVQKPYTAAANGLLREVIEEDDARVFVFEARDPMASYLVTLNVAEFGLFDAEGPRGIPVRIYHPLDASEEELEPFRRQPEVLSFLETRFGPYPFEAAGGVLSYESIGGALECQTLPVYGRGSGLDVIVHELAHQWYGDSVSPDLWRDMWLNEGFASYAGWLWDEHERGAEAYQATVRRAYGELRRRKTGSPFDPGVERVFSGRVYTRGAMVLHGLRAEVGDETFFRILQSWAAERGGANGSTYDFVALAARVAERDLKPFFDSWLFAEITPPVAAFEPLEASPERRRPSGEARAEGDG